GGGAVELAQGQPGTLDVLHHAGGHQGGGRVDHAADHAPGLDVTGDGPVRVHGAQAGGLERPARAREGPPGGAVLGRAPPGGRAGTTAVSGPRRGPSRGAISARWRALSVRMTESALATTSRSSVQGGCATKLPSASRTSTPRSRIAARCAPRAIRVTSTPPRAM